MRNLPMNVTRSALRTPVAAVAVALRVSCPRESLLRTCRIVRSHILFFLRISTLGQSEKLPSTAVQLTSQHGITDLLRLAFPIAVMHMISSIDVWTYGMTIHAYDYQRGHWHVVSVSCNLLIYNGPLGPPANRIVD